MSPRASLERHCHTSASLRPMHWQPDALLLRLPAHKPGEKVLSVMMSEQHCITCITLRCTFALHWMRQDSDLYCVDPTVICETHLSEYVN